LLPFSELSDRVFVIITYVAAISSKCCEMAWSGLCGLKESDNLWWDAFATEFFEDDAMLTLSFSMEDGPKRYSEFNMVILLYGGFRLCRYLFCKVHFSSTEMCNLSSWI